MVDNVVVAIPAPGEVEALDVDHASHAAFDAWRGRWIAADGSRRIEPGMVKAHEPVLVPAGLMNDDRS